ncbi:MAG: exodeoxyribonuclease VII large subunit, partial [Clostridia bacterium]|nr:exodeoxyribonuclease VII large subunit [Clostridia bacterium]
MLTPTVLSVSQLNRYVKSIIDGDAHLKNVFVSGEVSNFTNHYRTGHWYMSIKDGESSVKAVMFKMSNMRLRFEPENGMKVIVRGRVSVFERDGQYQLYIDDMQPEGAGELAIAFEQLKAKLAAKGIFDPEIKKEIPSFPERIGVVTSDTGAAVHDIINIISRRFPLAELVLAPVQVQGAQAAGQIADAIDRFNLLKGADVLIVGRGGGSAEDLWAFNEEAVAMAIYRSEIPVISAVGHETDFTISDFAADLRAPTPSAAAELAVPDIRDHKALVNAYYSMCFDSVLQCVESKQTELEIIAQRLDYLNPETVIDNKIQILDMLSHRIDDKIKEIYYLKNSSFIQTVKKLDALNPMKVMTRGYAAVYNKNKPVSSVNDVKAGDRL